MDEEQERTMQTQHPEGAGDGAAARHHRRPGGRARRRIASLVAAVTAATLALSGCSVLSLAFLPEFLDQQGRGTEAGPDDYELPDMPGETLEDFQSQQPDWVDCGGGMLCADVWAPEDWNDLSGEWITLSLVKQPALGGSPMGTLFVNPGGPGASGGDFVYDSIDSAAGPALQRDFDVIGWDPRGVGASSAVSCLDPAEMDDYLYGLGDTAGLEEGSDEWIAAAVQENADFGRACQERTGDLVGFVDTASTVQDLDMLRAIVGDPKLNYLGYSYGTYIGARYADRYPEKVGRLVLDGAMDPSATLFDVVREQTLGCEVALRAYVTDCLSRKECPLDGSVDEAMAQISALLDQLDAKPITASDGRVLGASTMLTAIITPLYSQDSWDFLDELFQTVPQGDAETAFWLADFYNGRNSDGSYSDNSAEAFAAINCLDYPRDLDPERMRAEAAELAKIAPTIGRFQGYGDVSCAEWPVPGVTERGRVTAAGADPILVIGTTGDPATPYRWAVSLAEQLQSGVLLTYQGEGHTAYGGSACIDDAVEQYFLKGTVPKADPKCS